MADVVNISVQAEDMFKGSQGLLNAAKELEDELQALRTEERLLISRIAEVRKKISSRECQQISCLATAELLLNKTETEMTIANRVNRFYGA